MKLQQLRQFVTLAETLNFHRAAERLNMAQPPLSISIRKLEQELGAPLFTRGHPGVQLTPEGLAALDDARQALLHAEQVQRVVRESTAGERGQLRLGFVGSATYHLLPRLLRGFRARFPMIEVVLAESRTSDLLDEVETGAIDAAIVRTPILTGAPTGIALLETDRLCLAVSKDSRFAGRKRARLAEFRDEPFVSYSRASIPSMHALTMMTCQEAGFVPNIAEQATQLQTIVCLVESGLGVALVPAVIAQQTAAVDFIEIEGKSSPVTIGLGMVVRSHRPPPAALRLRAFAIEQVSAPQ
jgi:DNA-binding transcriptional LysR family regulator